MSDLPNYPCTTQPWARHRAVDPQGAVAALAVTDALRAGPAEATALAGGSVDEQAVAGLEQGVDTLHDRLKPTHVPAVRRLGERLVEYKAAS